MTIKIFDILNNFTHSCLLNLVRLVRVPITPKHTLNYSHLNVRFNHMGMCKVYMAKNEIGRRIIGC